MTETDTRNGRTLLAATLGVLVPTLFLLAIAAVGDGEVGRAAQAAWYALPVLVLVGMAFASFRLLRSRRAN